MGLDMGPLAWEAAQAPALGDGHAQRLFALSQDLLCVASAEGRFLKVNPAFSRLLGYTEAELTGRPFLDFVVPEDLPATLAELDTLAAGGATFRFENRYLSSLGAVVRLSWRANWDPGQGLIYASARDVTEEWRTREALEAAHEELRLKSEALQAHTLALQEQSGALHAQTEELHAQADQLQQQTKLLFEQGLRLEGLNRELKRRNEATEAEVQARTSELEAANRSLWALNEQLRSAKELKGRILDTVPVGIAFLDRDLVFRWANPHYPAPDFPGQGLSGRRLEEVHPKIQHLFLPILEGVMRTGQPYKGEGLAIPREDGGVRHWDAHIEPARDEDGEVDGLLIVIGEATDRVERERLQVKELRQLQEIDALKDEFLAVISHECRTPIHAIMGFASALEDELVGPLNEEQRRSVRHILGGADRILALVDDLLDMSRIQAGKFVLAPQWVDVEALCQGLLGELSALAAAKGQELSLVVPTGQPALWADPVRLGQALSNLLGNAIKFSPKGSQVFLSLAHDRQRMWFAVRDQGPGIPKAEQARLFQPFTQLDMSTTRNSGGTGLGLSIVKAIAEAHGGQVGVESDRGMGSTFFLGLPLRPEGTP